MNRRQFLQAASYGALCSPLAAWSRTSGELTVGQAGPVAAGAKRTEEAGNHWPLNGGPWCVSICIGLGPAAASLVDALRACHDLDVRHVDFHCQHGTDPDTIATWSDAPPYPSDLIVLVIDARDPDVLAHLPFWTARLADQGETRAAIVIGDDARDPDTPWRRELTASFDGVIDVCSQCDTLRAASAAILTDGLLMLRSTLIGYDVADVRATLRLGPTLRTAATVWSQESRGTVAVRKLCARLQPTAGGGVLAFLHAASTVTMAEFSWLNDQLRESLPDDALTLVTIFIHADWPPSRRVLGLTLADAGPTCVTPSART